MKNKKSNMSLSKEILYSVEWQSLRVSLLGNFVTESGMRANLAKLEAYLLSANDKQEDARRRVRIVNLLNATRMGFHGMKIVGSIMDILLVEFREAVKEYSEEDIGDSWDWKEVERDLKALKLNDNATYNLIYKNLIARTKMANYKCGTTDNRPELMKFLSLMK